MIRFGGAVVGLSLARAASACMATGSAAPNFRKPRRLGSLMGLLRQRIYQHIRHYILHSTPIWFFGDHRQQSQSLRQVGCVAVCVFKEFFSEVVSDAPVIREQKLLQPK